MSLTDLVILLSSIDGPRLGRLVIIYYKLGFKVARYSFSRSIPPKFEHKLLRHNTGLEKLPPQLYQIKMKICYDQGCNDIGVVIATK